MLQVTDLHIYKKKLELILCYEGIIFFYKTKTRMFLSFIYMN